MNGRRWSIRFGGYWGNSASWWRRDGNGSKEELPALLADPDNGLPALARETFTDLAARLRALNERITGYDQRLQQLARESEPARRLMAVNGVGPVTATAVVASVGDGHESAVAGNLRLGSA